MVEGHKVGNWDRKQRGMKKNERNVKRAQGKGCRFLVLVVLAGCGATVASGYLLAQQLFG